MTCLKAVFFDADGVLLDSLVPHLQICVDKSREYGLDLKIPSPAEFRKLARSGVRISPMRYFFMAVGFPEEAAERANREYQEVFARLYRPRPFPGVYETLKTLHDAGLKLGIVTSNIRTNVVDALGPSNDFFPPDNIFSKDRSSGSSKIESLMVSLAFARVKPSEALYIGDQLADWTAAKAARTNFLGVTYGWGISEEDHEFPLVTRISDISRYVLESKDKVFV